MEAKKKAPPTLKYCYYHSKDYPEYDVSAVGYRWKDGKLEVQVARCRYPDRFSKKIAHAICEGRMAKHGPLMVYNINDPAKTKVAEFLAGEFHPDSGTLLGSAFMLESGDEQ